jgi:hypothetical protein
MKEGLDMNETIYRQQDITCDRCQHTGAGNIVDSVSGWAHVRCLSCGWVSSQPEV